MNKHAAPFVWLVALASAFGVHLVSYHHGYIDGDQAAKTASPVASETDVLRALMSPQIVPLVFPPSSELVHQSTDIQPAPKKEVK